MFIIRIPNAWMSILWWEKPRKEMFWRSYNGYEYHMKKVRCTNQELHARKKIKITHGMRGMHEEKGNRGLKKKEKKGDIKMMWIVT